jgi:phage terminase small subunit
MTNGIPAFQPPSHLSPRSRQLWTAVVPHRAKSAPRLALLQAALEALDRADCAREAVEQHGMVSTTKTTGAVHINPLTKLERESRQQFARIWSELNLAYDPQIDGVSVELAMRRMHENTEAALDELSSAGKASNKR